MKEPCEKLTHYFGMAWDIARLDVAAQYGRHRLGIVWSFLTPLGLLAIYSIVFGVFLKVDWEGGGGMLGYVGPFFAGLSVYLFFADLVSTSPRLFFSKRNLVERGNFPLWVVWLSNVFRSLVITWPAIGFSLILAAFLGHWSPMSFILLLPALVLIMLVGCGISLILSAVGPFIGDVQELARLFLRIAFYAAPVTYPLNRVPSGLRDVMYLNPLTGVVEFFRRTLYSAADGVFPSLIASVVIGCLITLIGLWMLGRVKDYVCDVI